MRSSTASRVRAVRWRTNSTPSLTKLALDLPSRRARRSSYRSCSSVNRMWTRVNGHALLYIRKFEGGSESRPPVARFSPTVGHGDDLDFVLAHSVHQGEGKSREDISTSAASMAWPCARIVGNGVDRNSSRKPCAAEASRAAYQSYADSASCAAAGWNLTAAGAIQRRYNRALSSSQGIVSTAPESSSTIRRSISTRHASSAPSSDSASKVSIKRRIRVARSSGSSRIASSNSARADLAMTRSYHFNGGARCPANTCSMAATNSTGRRCRVAASLPDAGEDDRELEVAAVVRQQHEMVPALILRLAAETSD